jgi:hypothetical protein
MNLRKADRRDREGEETPRPSHGRSVPILEEAAKVNFCSAVTKVRRGDSAGFCWFDQSGTICVYDIARRTTDGVD